MKIKFYCLLLVGFYSVSQAYAQNSIGLSIIQDKNEYKITRDTQTIRIKATEFELIFNSFAYTDQKFYATHVDAFYDNKGTAMIHPGEVIDSIPYFSPGTGLACDKDKEYKCMYIDKDLGQQHYITYDEINKDRRAKLVSKDGDTLRLSWTIKKFSTDNQKETSIKKIGGNPLYIVVLNDFNLNGIVDEGEYRIVKIVFE